MIPVIAVYNIPKSIDVAYDIYQYILRNCGDQSGIKCIKVIIDNVKAAQNTAIAFILTRETMRTQEHLGSLVNLFDNQTYRFNNETRVLQARVEFNNPKEYHSSNTRNSINIDIVVVTYQNWEPRTHYHTNHRSVTKDLETMVQPLADNPATTDQIDGANNNNGSTRNDDQSLADNPTTPEQIEDGAKPNSTEKIVKLTPRMIEAILSNARPRRNLEAIASWLNYAIADDLPEGTDYYKEKSILD